MKNDVQTKNTYTLLLQLSCSPFVCITATIVMLFVLSACGTNPASISQTDSLTPLSTSSTTNNPSATSSPTTQYPVKVYFSDQSSSTTDFSHVVAVNRVSPTSAVGAFAVEQLVAGPTAAEQNQGLFSELHNTINGPSNCAGQNDAGSSDFLLELNKKGSVTEQGTATLKFCRAINSLGIGSDARIQSEINATLKQFSTIQKVVILTKDGGCFGDESGLNLCIK